MYNYWLCAFLCTLLTYAGIAQDPFLQDLGLKWTGGSTYLLQLAETVPEEHFDFRPTPEQMSLGEQLRHMAGNVSWLTTDYLHGDGLSRASIDAALSKAETMAVLKASLEGAGSAIRQLDPAALDEEVSFFAGPMSRRRILFLLNDHLTHHRGQLVVYLRLLGLKPPPYRGW